MVMPMVFDEVSFCAISADQVEARVEAFSNSHDANGFLIDGKNCKLLVILNPVQFRHLKHGVIELLKGIGRKLDGITRPEPRYNDVLPQTDSVRWDIAQMDAAIRVRGSNSQVDVEFNITEPMRLNLKLKLNMLQIKDLMGIMEDFGI